MIAEDDVQLNDILGIRYSRFHFFMEAESYLDAQAIQYCELVRNFWQHPVLAKYLYSASAQMREEDEEDEPNRISSTEYYRLWQSIMAMKACMERVDLVAIQYPELPRTIPCVSDMDPVMQERWRMLQKLENHHIITIPLLDWNLLDAPPRTNARHNHTFQWDNVPMTQFVCISNHKSLLKIAILDSDLRNTAWAQLLGMDFWFITDATPLPEILENLSRTSLSPHRLGERIIQTFPGELVSQYIQNHRSWCRNKYSNCYDYTCEEDEYFHRFLSREEPISVPCTEMTMTTARENGRLAKEITSDVITINFSKSL